MKRIAVLTSGGDAPGMNAALRAVVSTAALRGIEVIGVQHGYRGLLGGELLPLDPGMVANIMPLAGSLLGTSRCDEFRGAPCQAEAERTLRARQIDALIVIGGNGSQSGAHALAQRGVAVVGIASTIDNDLLGTEISIGATSAVGVAVEAIERLRATALAHQRAFLVEVMGRHCGYLAAAASIASGAEAFIVPEFEPEPTWLAARLWSLYEHAQRHAIVVVSEGAQRNAHALADYFTTHAVELPFELRVTRLGHVQRGATPSVYDRMLASRMGVAAVEHLLAGTRNVLIGLRDGAIKTTPLAAVANAVKPADPQLLEIAKTLTLPALSSTAQR